MWNYAYIPFDYVHCSYPFVSDFLRKLGLYLHVYLRNTQVFPGVWEFNSWFFCHIASIQIVHLLIIFKLLKIMLRAIYSIFIHVCG